MGSVALAHRLLSVASVVVGHKLSCSMACEIFLPQGFNQCPLHCRTDSYPPDHQGSPPAFFFFFFSLVFLLVVKFLNNFWLLASSPTVAHQAPLSMGFPIQEYWSGLPFPSPEYLLNPGIKLTSPSWQTNSLPLSHQKNFCFRFMFCGYHKVCIQHLTVEIVLFLLIASYLHLPI